GSVDLNTSKKTGNDPECAIAKNPANPLQLFVMCNTDGLGLFAARSTDGGASWIYPDPADKTIADGDPDQGDSACCDPTLAWDSFGNLFLTYLGGPGVATLLSTDGGATFSELPGFGGGPDQPTVVTADTTSGSVVWIVYNTGSMVARGAVVTGLGAVGAWSGVQTAPGTSGCSFGDIAVAPNGKVVQACGEISPLQGPNNEILVNTDPDGLGAAGFGAAVVATTTNVGGFDNIPAQNQRTIDAEAGLAYDRNPASPHFGRLYLMYNDEQPQESHDLDVMVRWSDDDGATWSEAVRVNDDATTKSQFLPRIASDPATGALAVCWHDCRNSAPNTAMEIFCSHSFPVPPAPSFTANVLLSDGASISNGQGVEFGDYAGLIYVDGVAHPVWADKSNSTGDNPDGTAKFDSYVDFTLGALFTDGFESGDLSAWDESGS
ncbi:MAG: sialidase family protein, partial [Thermoanaerobaculia bacterium]